MIYPDQISPPKSAVADLEGALASRRNLMGFLDAFKAILPFRAGLSRASFSVMAGLVPAIHVFSCSIAARTWMPGTRPGMTTFGKAPFHRLLFESAS
jgi:hypothetical protein